MPSSLSSTVSVVVPVFQGGAAFRRCLGAIEQLDPAPDELIVVADGADPADARAAEAAGAHVLQHSPARGPAYARNRGAEAARGDVLFFVDADCEAHPDAVARVREHLRPGRPGGPDAVIGSYDDAPAARGVLSEYRNLLHHYTHQHGAAEARTFWGACGAIRREAFRAVGGFDEGYRQPSIEDIELGYRLTDAGYRIRLDPALQVTHLKRWRPADVIRTDLVKRALPWSRLLLQRGGLPDDLNTDRMSQASVSLAGTAALATLASLRSPKALWAALASLAAIGALNADFYRFLASRHGSGFALRAFPWHVAYFACAGAGYAWAFAEHVWTSPASTSAHPTTPSV